MKKGFSRSFDELDRIFEFSERFYTDEGIEDAARMAINLAIEEIFTNMVKYTPEGSEDIVIGLLRNGTSVEVSLSDNSPAPFDPTSSPDVDVAAPLEQRHVGGLGLHLVRRVMDDVSYEYRDRTSTVRMTKRLE